VIDLLMSGDLLLDDRGGVDRLVQLLVERMGLPEQRPSWGHDSPDYKAMFFRVHRRLVVAPTTIEILSGGAVNEGALQAQRHRPVRTHATVFASRTFDDVVAHVERAGVRHVLYPPDEALPFGRLWLGVGSDGSEYQSDVDGGLRIEVIPYDGLRIPEVPFDEPRSPGSYERMVARTFIVEDVPWTLERMEASLGWNGGAEVVDGAYGPTAVIRPTLDTSAVLELVQPTRPGPPLDFFQRYGAGPYSIRLGVHGLDVALADLTRRGTAFRLDGEVATVDPAALDGAVVELADV
jgi:hypothetical protein